jgi:hypothetical protein
VIGWKNALLAGGLSNITVRDVYLGAVRATLQYGADQSRLPDNPAAGVKIRVKKALRERDKGFDQGEALKILTATRSAPSANISVEMAAALRWVPWMCAYSGARERNHADDRTRHRRARWHRHDADPRRDEQDAQIPDGAGAQPSDRSGSAGLREVPRRPSAVLRAGPRTRRQRGKSSS